MTHLSNGEVVFLPGCVLNHLHACQAHVVFNVIVEVNIPIMHQPRVFIIVFYLTIYVLQTFEAVT